MIRILDFSLTTCGPCKVVGKYLEKLKKEIPSKDISIETFILDSDEIDEERVDRLLNKYNVMHVPTLLVVRDDEVIDTFVGISGTYDEFKNKILTYIDYFDGVDI